MQLNVLYIHQYFKTPEEGGVTRSYEIAKYLVEKGHKVTMLTSWNKPQQEEKIIDGITVIYLPIAYDNAFSFTRRIRSFLKFKSRAITYGKLLHKPDVIYATSTPLSVGAVGKQLAKHFNCPWVFEIRDLWPEVPVRLGIIKSELIKKRLYKLETQLLQSANKIVVLSPYNQKYVDNIVAEKSVLVPNFSNNERYALPKTSNEPTDKFRIGYFGAISTANGLDAFIDLARYAQQNNLHQFEFVLAGKGKSKQQLIEATKELNNLIFLPHQDKTEIAKTMLTCQASYISFINHPIMQSCSPNKFFDSIASGRLIITNTKGWISELVEKEHCGFYVNSSKAFFEQIQPFVSSKDTLQQAQQNAKQLALTQFDKTVVINRVHEVLLSVTK